MIDIETIGVGMETAGLEKGRRALEATEKAANRTADAADALSNKAKGMDASMRGAGVGVDALSAKTKAAEAAMLATANGANLLAKAAGLLASGAVVKGFLDRADAITVMNNQLKLATGSTQAATVASTQLFDIAQRGRVAFTDLGSTYASISRAAAALGVSQQRQIVVTEAIANAMAAGGASASSMQAALVQLGQGLASGTLRGDELNSVMEQSPRLAQALADGLGITTGQLRAMGAQGEITAEKVIRALESQAAVLRNEVAGATMTVGQGWTVLGNSVTVAVGQLDKATGASEAVANALKATADGVTSLGAAIKNNETAITTVLGVLGGAATAAGIMRVVGAIAAVRTAVVGLAAVAAAANPVTLALLGVGVVTGAVIGANSARKSSMEGMAEEIERTTERIAVAERQLAAAGGSKGAMTKQLEDRIAAMRKYRDEMQQTWSAKSIEGLDTSAEDARFARHTEQMKKDAAAADELASIRRKLSGVDENYLPTLTKLHAQYEAGKLSLPEYQRLVEKLAQDNYKKSDAEKAALQATHALDNKYKEFRGTLQEKLAQQQLEMGTGQKLTESDKLRIQFMALLGDEFKKLSIKRQVEIDGLINQLALGEEEIKQIKRRQSAYQAYLDDQKEQRDAEVARTNAVYQNRNAVIDYETAILNQNKATELEISLIGQSEAARRKAVEVLRLQIEEEKKLDEINKTPYEKESDREEQRARVRSATAIAIANAGNRVILDEWLKTADQINQSLTDALMRGFESGKGFMRNLVDTTANLFKTLVLRPIVKAIVDPVGLSFAGLSTAANASDAASNVTNGFNIANLGTSIAALGGNIANLTSAFTTGWSGFFGGSSLTNMATAGSMFGSAGSAAATAGYLAGPVAIAAVVANALGLFRKTTQVGAGLSGTLGEGDISTYALMRKSGTLFQGPDYTLQNKGIAEQSAALQTAYQTMRAATAGMATQLGLSADAVVNFTTRLGNDLIHPDTGGYGLKLDGLSQEQIQAKVSEALASANDALAQQILGTWTTATETVTRVITEEGGHWDSGVETITREITETIEKTAYQASEFAKTGETASQTLARLSGDLGVVNAAFDTLGATLLKGLKGADQASSLVSAFGGQDAFKTATAAYYEAFYSEEEKRSTLTRQVTEALAAQNLVMPATVEAYRALVEAQDLTTASGQDAAAVLVKLGPTFAKTLEGIEDDAKKTAAQVSQYLGPVNDAATQSNETLIKLLDERKSLEADLATAMGGTAAAIALATEGMDEQGKAAWAVNQILKQQIAAQEQINTARDSILSLQRDLMQAQFGNAAVAAFDLAQATKDMTADQRISYVQQVAIASAIQRAITVEGQKKSLQEELLSLTETSTEALVRQRAALDESVRAQFDAVQAAKAAKAAADERKNLEEEWLRLTGQTAALRARDLAQVSAGNRGYQQQIWAYEDLKTAQEKAVAAAERAIAAEQKRQDEIVTGAEKLVDSLGSVFELLSEQVRELYGQTDATKALLATQGMALIDQAIATGVLPTQKDLTQAITAARAGLDANSYSSKAEFTYAQLTLAGKLSLLRSDAQEQLTTAEQALAVAKQQQTTLEAQLASLKGVETGVLSVAQAIAAAVAANAALAAASGVTPGAVSGGSTPSSSALAAFSGDSGALWNDNWVRAPGDGTLYRPDEFKALVNTAVTTQQGAMDVFNGLKSSGMTGAEFEQRMGWTSGTVAAFAAANGLPAFENGGMHSGGLRLVGERGWEVEATGPARYWNQQQLGQAMSGVNTERLETLVADMSAEIASLRAELRDIKTNTGRSTDILDRVSEGGGRFRTKEVA